MKCTAAAVSTCVTPFFGYLIEGRGSFLAWDPAQGALIASACVDAACAHPIPVGYLNPLTCNFAPILTLPAFVPESASYESAAYNNDTRQVRGRSHARHVSRSTSSCPDTQAIFSVSVFDESTLEGESLLVAVNLTSGDITVFNETLADNIGSISYDPASGLLFGITVTTTPPAGAVSGRRCIGNSSRCDSGVNTYSYLVSVDSAGFTWRALTATFVVAPSPRRVRWFWSAGSAWGTVELAPTRRRTKVTLTCTAGWLRLRRLELTGFGVEEFKTEKTLAPGRSLTIEIAPAA